MLTELKAMQSKAVRLAAVAAVCTLRWWLSNRNQDFGAADALLSVNSAYAGYHYLMLVGTINVLLLTLLFTNLPLQQLVIRKSRAEITGMLLGQAVMNAALFTLIDSGVNVIGILIRVPAADLVKTGFWLATALYLLMAFLFYVVMGLIYQLIVLLSAHAVVAVLGTFGLSLAMIMLALHSAVPVMLSAVNTYDLVWGRSGLSRATYLAQCVNQLVPIVGLYLLLAFMCRRKDVLHE